MRISRLPLTKVAALVLGAALVTQATAATAASAGVYRSDAVGDAASGGGATTMMKRAVDITRVTTWTEGTRLYLRAAFSDVTSSPTVVAVPAKVGTTFVRLNGSKSTATAPYLEVGPSYQRKCTSQVRETWDAARNTATLSVPVACLPSGTYLSEGRTIATVRTSGGAWAQDTATMSRMRLR